MDCNMVEKLELLSALDLASLLKKSFILGVTSGRSIDVIVVVSELTTANI